MSYLVLARKYRPQTFEDLVGQGHVTTTLVNALEAGRLAHAYIFSGPRGCGKTTTARLLAKALNCEKGPTPKPCGVCPQCKEIASGNSPDDVLEIDGASNRGIDQIRELRDTIKYAPARSRHRIYIIDEAHQITDAGFNALLKTLEEPPPHAVLMMATTESQKIPATILSRCQRFQLKPIPPLEIERQLKKILAQEKISIEDQALEEIARAANGSLRDSLSLMDQVIAYSPQGASAEQVRSLLGLLPQEAVRQFANVIRGGSPQKVLQAVQKAVEDGFDLFQLAQDLLDYWHRILLHKNGVQVPLGGTEKELESYSLPQLERFLHILSRSMEQMRRSEAPRVVFELGCLELSQKTTPVDELLDRLEALEKRLQEGTIPEVKKKLDPDEPREDLKTQTPSVIPAVLSVPPPSPVPSREDQTFLLRPDQVRTAWTRMLEEVGQRKPSLENFLLRARWEVKPNNGLHILCSDVLQSQQISVHLNFVKDLLQKHVSGAFAVQCVLQAAPAIAPPGPSPAAQPPAAPPLEEEDEAVDKSLLEEPPDLPPDPAPASAAVESPAVRPSEDLTEMDPGLKKVLNRFPGKLKKIESAPLN